MRIGINTLSLIPGHIGGMETYLVNLIQALANIDTQNQYFLFVTPANKTRFVIMKDNFVTVECKVPAQSVPIRVAWEQAFLPWQILRLRLDVMHFPCNISSIFVPCKCVLTIHDLSSFYYSKNLPGYMDTKYLICLKSLLKYSSKRADRIITDSHSTKEDVIRYLKVNPNKIEVVYLGRPSNKIWKCLTPSTISNVLQNYNLNSKYILTIGNKHKHKNFDRLLEAVVILKRKYEQPHKLVMVGMKGTAYSELLYKIKVLNLSQEVIVTDYIPDEHIPALYSAADVFVFPSCYEGFGLPPLEAMTLGVPVVSSNAASLPEVVGDAAILFNPFDVNEMAEAIYKVINDLTFKKELVKRGYERVKKFSWDKTAKNTLAIYEEIYNSYLL